jgi:hypothetical protein
MVLPLPGKKGNSALGAEGRFDPADGREAIGAKALSLFLQERLTAITLGREKKLKEGL